MHVLHLIVKEVFLVVILAYELKYEKQFLF